MSKRDKKLEREARLRRERAEEEARELADRRRLVGLIKELGGRETLKAMPTFFIDSLMKLRYLPPQVVIGEEARGQPGADRARAALVKAFESTTVVLAPDGVKVTLGEFFTHYKFIVDAFKIGIADASAGVEAAYHAFGASLLPHYGANIQTAVEQMYLALDWAVLYECRVDRVIFWPSYVFDPQIPGKPRMVVTLHATSGQRLDVKRDGAVRPAWRCGLPHGAHGVDWVAWAPSVLGRAGEGPSLPVYIQSHALERLHERLPWNQRSVSNAMWCSLVEPVLVRKGEPPWLVEYRISEFRFGYFTAEEVDGVVLLTSFLFLTMKGTPEGEELRRRLRLKTRDIEWLKMDKLEYFARSDVREDPELIKLFVEMGCKHLLQIHDPGWSTPFLAGAARTTRQYLGMKLSGAA